MIHAGGGDGDIVIQYENRVVMLEATLMNKQAQKRGEWEPVLRHSLNLKAANEEKETMTFFIADELDHNTINIWRAVAAVSLESTNSHKMVDGVAIMPFTNGELLDFLKKRHPGRADHRGGESFIRCCSKDFRCGLERGDYGKLWEKHRFIRNRFLI